MLQTWCLRIPECVSTLHNTRVVRRPLPQGHKLRRRSSLSPFISKKTQHVRANAKAALTNATIIIAICCIDSCQKRQALGEVSSGWQAGDGPWGRETSRPAKLPATYTWGCWMIIEWVFERRATRRAPCAERASTPRQRRTRCACFQDYIRLPTPDSIAHYSRRGFPSDEPSNSRAELIPFP